MPKGHWIPFTKEQEDLIRSDYLIKPVKRLADELSVSHNRIMNFLKKNNLELPRELIEKRIQDSRRKKGDIPANKGKKQTEYMTPEAIEKTKKTRFKKGNIPFNTNPEGDGAIVSRVDSNGRSYKYIRISLGVWELYHRYLWEKEYGRVPENHIIVFKDKNTENTTLENLELITMTENMYRNSIHNFPEEIIPSMVLLKELENKLKTLQNG
ncbi:HNH endonuclease signature motif containing protein [Flavobacterium sp. HNIBRBA15423]|uniref:HNH endonuclease signature motif containing protein n=1 Tax=Flavobacterium sp. HNIBRBA15423 TaxID=3458683 RepID=UPI004044522D